jgi:hypothetical protein
MSGGANHSRLTSTTYPNGRVIGTIFSGIDHFVRPTNVNEGASFTCTSSIEQSSYLGRGAVVERFRRQPNTRLTYMKQPGESNGADGGDQYRGLDRFDRVIEQRWRGKECIWNRH